MIDLQFPLSEDDYRALLAVPASALDDILGTSAPDAYVVHRADGRPAHHSLRTAIDRLRREYEGHPASTAPFVEDVERLRRLLSPVLAPWPALWDASPEATDREVQAEWEALLSPWADGIELEAAPVRRRHGDPPLPAGGRAGFISVPGRGGTTWRLDDMLSSSGIRRIRGLGRLGTGALHVFWRPASGSGTCAALLVDDVTDEEHPLLPPWTLWAQPHCIVQTSLWKTQLIFRLPNDLAEQGDQLTDFLNGRLGDPQVHDLGHWMRLPGTWNHKTPCASWCARILAMGRSSAMEAGWLRNEAARMAKEATAIRDVSVCSSVHSSGPQSRPVSPQERTQEGGTSERKPLPEPEDVKEGRNVEATRAVGRYLAQHWGDAAGATMFLRSWNSRLPSPLDEAELMTILRSIIREDQENHPGRWQGREAVPLPRRSSVRPSAPVRFKAPQAGQKPSLASDSAVTRTASASAPAMKSKSASTTACISEAELAELVRWHIEDQKAQGVFPGMPDDVREGMLRSEIRKRPGPWRAAARRGTSVEDGEDGPRR